MRHVLLLFICFYWNCSFAQNNQQSENIQNAHINNSWIPLGPFQSSGNYGDIGAIGSIAVVSHKKELHFLVAPFNGTGGIFQTKNKGITWENVTDSQGLSYVGIAAIAQSVKYKNLVVAGINAPLGGIIYNENYGEEGQWKTTRSLERQLNNEAQLAPELYNRQRCIDVLIHPKTYKKKQPLVFYVGAHVLYRSTAGGLNANWESIINTWNEDPIHSVAISPVAPYSIFVATTRWLIRSDDLGSSWTKIDSFENFPTGFKVTNLRLRFLNNGVLYLVTRAGSQQGSMARIYRSADNGDHFSIREDRESEHSILNMNFNVLKIAPFHEGNWYMEKSGGCSGRGFDERIIWMSKDTGKTFYPLGDAQNTHCDIRCLEFVATEKKNFDDEMICGNDGGVSLLERNQPTKKWRDINGYGLNISRFSHLDIAEQQPGMIIAGAFDGDINFKKSYRDAWENNGAGDMFQSFIDEGNNFQTHQVINGNLLGSNLPGPDFGFDCNRRGYFDDAKITRSENNRNHLFAIPANIKNCNAAFEHIYEAKNGFQSFQSIESNNSVKPSALTYSELDSCLYFSGSGPRWWNKEINAWDKSAGVYLKKKTNGSWQPIIDLLNIDSSNNGLFIKDDRADLWHNRDKNTSNASPLANNCSITALSANTKISGDLWAGLSGNFAYETQILNGETIPLFHKVYHSCDGGIHWENISNGLPDADINCFWIEPNERNRIFIGTTRGVYFLNNRFDTTWKLLGKPIGTVQEIKYLKKENRLYVATFGRGIWTMDLD